MKTYLFFPSKEVQQIELPYCPQIGSYMTIPMLEPGVGGDYVDHNFKVTSVVTVLSPRSEDDDSLIYFFIRVYLETTY